MLIYKKITITEGGGGSEPGSDDKRVKVSTDDAQSGFLEEKIIAASARLGLTILNPGVNEQIQLDVDETAIDHNNLTNYDIAEHRIIDDASTTTTSLWSSDKIQTELDSKINAATPMTDNKLIKSVGTSGVDVEATAIDVDDSNNVTGINNLTIDGDLTVNGTTTTVNTTNLDVTDANITVNNGGTQASADAQDAGLTVEMSDATDAQIAYDSSLESKFKVGEIGTESEVVSTTHTQELQNKTINANNNSISNIDTANLEAGVLSTDLSIAGSDDTLASTLAIQSYVENAISQVESYTPNKTFYVDDSNGDDLNSGSIHKPFKTIQAAIDAVTEQGSLIHVNTGVYNENLVLAGKYNLIISTDGNTDSPITYILGTINLVDSESVRFRNFGIQRNTTDPIIKFGEVSPVAPVSGSGRHFFESCAITNLSGGTVVEVGDGVKEFLVFRSCTFIGHIDMSDITSTGSSVSLISCTSEGSTITVGTNQVLFATQCLSVGSITHTNGVIYLKDIDILQKNGTGDSLVSSATFSPSNLIFIEDVSLYDAETQSYGKLTIPQTAFILNLSSRGENDVLNETLRLTRGQKSIDIHYDNSVSGISAIDVQNAIDEVEGRLETAENDITNNASELQDHLNDTVGAHAASSISYDNSVSGLSSIDVKNAIDELSTNPPQGTTDIYQVTKEPTGFPNRTDSVISFDDVTYTLTIAPTSGSFDFYVKGEKYTKSSPETITIDNTQSGNHYFYYNENGVLSSTQVVNASLFEDNALVSIVYWNTDINQHIYFAEERHGLQMDGATHGYLHTTFGARFLSGHALDNFTIGTGALDSSAQFTADEGSIRDEDLIIQSPAQSQIPILYRQGDLWRKKSSDSFPLIYSGTAGYSGTNIPYNEFNGTSWQLTEVGDNEFVLVHFFATNDKDNPIVGIQGINAYNNVPDAKNAAGTEISSLSGIPFIEFVAIGTVIFKTSSSFGNTPKAIVTPINGSNYVDFRGTQLYTPAGEATTHSLLSGLAADDHLQYLTESRADNWYEGKISPGDLQETSDSLIQNQTGTNVTGLFFDPLVVRSFVAEISVEIDADNDLFEKTTIIAINKSGSWDYTIESQGDETLVEFTLDNSGQILYNSNIYTGFIAGLIKFRATTTTV